MSDEIMIMFDEDGTARKYRDDFDIDFDITIHCESKEEQEEVWKRLTQGDWTPIYEDLPEDLLPVNVTWTNRNPETYYENIKGKRFVDTAVYYQGDWYWWTSVCVDYLKEYGDRAPVERIDRAIEIIAWKSLPEPYRGEQDENR